MANKGWVPAASDEAKGRARGGSDKGGGGGSIAALGYKGWRHVFGGLLRTTCPVPTRSVRATGPAGFCACACSPVVRRRCCRAEL